MEGALGRGWDSGTTVKGCEDTQTQCGHILIFGTVKAHLSTKTRFHGPHIILSQGAHRALCPRCAKSRLFSTTSSHGSQGP